MVVIKGLTKLHESIFNNSKFDILGDKYLSQGLIAISRKITQVTAAERGGRAGRPREHLSQQTRSIDPMLFYCWPDIFDVGTT